MQYKSNHQPLARIRVSLEAKIALMLQEPDKSTDVTFVREDGSKVIQTLSDVFLQGKNPSIIVADLKAIQHDLNAKYFTV
jgi:hypothetical protein